MNWELVLFWLAVLFTVGFHFSFVAYFIHKSGLKSGRIKELNLFGESPKLLEFQSCAKTRALLAILFWIFYFGAKT